MKFSKFNAKMYGRRGGLQSAHRRRENNKIYLNGLYPAYISNVFKDKNGRCYAVIERPISRDFVVARGFNKIDKNTVDWGQGEYGYASRRLAVKRAKKLAYKKR